MTASIPPGPRYPRALQTVGWVARTGPFLERCRERYGDVFTLRIAQEGIWVMLADPEHVRQVFTGDPRVLHAGEGNAVLRPVLGPNSVLLLDEQQHLAQRKLLLPPFHGERMQRYGELMREVAERELDAWPRGRSFQLWPHMQSVTLEVIMRAVFGMQDGGGLDRLRAVLESTLQLGHPPVAALPAGRARAATGRAPAELPPRPRAGGPPAVRADRGAPARPGARRARRHPLAAAPGARTRTAAR